MVWENVEGAKTSPGGEHRGEDFAAVIEEIIRVAEPDAAIHVRVPDGGWPNAGCYFAEDGSWSLAWRLVDAQYFGTPQRRKRICLLSDFNGLSAPEILFDPQYERTTEDGQPISAVTSASSGGQEIFALAEGMQGYSEPSVEEGERTPARTESGAGDASYTLKIRGGVDIDSAGKRAGKGPLVQTELSGTLGVSQDQTLIQTGINGDVAGTLDASYYKGCGERQGIEREVVMSAGFSFGQSAKARSLGYEEERAPTIRGGEGGNQKPVVLTVSEAYGISPFESNAFKSSNPHSAIYKADTARTLDNNCGNPACNQGGIAVVEQGVKIMNPTDSQGNQIADSDGIYPTVRGCGGAGYQQGYCFDREYEPKTFPIEGNGARPSHFGSGYGKDGDPSFTLNHVEQHAVATYDARGNGDGQTTCTLTGDHQDRVTDYTALVLEDGAAGE